MNPYQEEIEVLKKEAPMLFSRPKRNAFRVPENYWSMLKETVVGTSFAREGGFSVPEGYLGDLEKGILDQTPSVENTGRKETLAVPDGYMDSLESSILARTIAMPDPKNRDRSARRIVLYTMTAAAAAVLLLFVSGVLFEQKETCQTFACLLEEATLEEDDLLELYDEVVIEEYLPENASMLDAVKEEDALIEYLLEEEDIDLTDLYELEEL